MPGVIRRCVLCAQLKRAPFSLYMTIDCAEQERRIQEGYRKRHKLDIMGSLINKQVHRSCYRSIIQRQTPATSRSDSHPRKNISHRRRQQSSQQASSTEVVEIHVPSADPPSLFTGATNESIENEVIQ